MASISINEEDFNVLANAAMDAKEHGNMDQANALDKLARKANVSLTGAKTGSMRSFARPGSKTLRWNDVPSVLID